MHRRVDEHARPGSDLARRVQPETRRRYLDLAAELVERDVATEPAFAHVASHVRLTTVAANLGVSRTSLYRQWDRQHDYWCDLTAFMIGRTLTQPDRDCTDLDVGSLESLLEWIRIEMAGLQGRLVTDPRRILCTSLLGYPPVPTLRDEMAAIERAGRHEVAVRLDHLLSSAGRTIVEPLTAEDLVAAIWLVADGVAHCAAVEPAIREARLTLDGDVDRPWTLTAYAARCVLVGLTAPSVPRRRPSAAPPPMPATRGSSRRWPPEKRAALEEGARLFAEHVRSPTGAGASPAVLGHISLARVARAADVTRRQLYHLWSSHDAFLHDLRARLRELEAASYRARFDGGVTAAIARLDLSRVALEISEHVNRGDAQLDERPLQPRFAFELHLTDPRIAADSRDSLDRVVDFHQEHVGALLGLTGASLRPGVTPLDLSRLFAAASHGSEVLRRLDPTAIRTGIHFRGAAYSMNSIACQAIVDHSVEATGP